MAEKSPSEDAVTKSGEATTSPVTTDTKEAFAAALARKNAANNARSQHLDGENHVHGSTSSDVTKRQFRRKSG